ncbi:MAG: CDP-alcohol phosphatidyltransferase family protein [Deltaproteobacteria bacterium]|nr:CDP-alcohol phosphatidyltransferase family protein [Deltaproteobacteria bacterium]
MAWREIADIYRASKKKKDINWWTEWVCRPPAAVLVYLWKDSRITPNQVTFLATLVAMFSAALLALLPGWWGAVVAALVFEFSFVLDCVDGQLARLRKQASTVGHHLDFLMDEIKAFLIFGAVAVRLWRFAETPDEGNRFLLVGIFAMACLGAGLSLTTFMRRPEYGAKPPTEDGQPAELRARRGLMGKAIGTLEHAARIVVHYPSYILLVALVPPGRLDIYFWAYAAVNALYAARSFLQVYLKLGRFQT